MVKVNKKKSGDQHMRGMLRQAGIDLFSEKGYASTSVREIVEKAGVTKPVLYYYFKNKEGMLRDILDCAAEMQDAILEEVLDQKGTVQERIIHLFQVLRWRLEYCRTSQLTSRTKTTATIIN